jgi:tetratricopeptide (TPR) repeat protein
VRGLVQIVSWLIDEYIVEPRSLRHPKEEPPPRAEKSVPRARESFSVSAGKASSGKDVIADTEKVSRPLRPSRVQRPSRLVRWLKSLTTVAVKKGYDYWVSSALAEDDRQAKVRYLSKALQLNPDYHPAWGMKGHALFELGKYDDAIECFDKSLEMHPSALVWYRKGLCLYHKGQSEESLRCLGKALKECPAHDRPLSEDISRMKRRVEEELRCAKAT